jgi:TonB-linked SusC/RagA family outer membrane protein
MQLTVIIRQRLHPGGTFTKTLLLMKLTAIVLLAACLHVHANSYAQKITLSENNASLDKLFQKIEKQSGYLFWYNNSMLQRAKTVNINVKDASLQQVLDIVFKDQPLSYSIIESVVVIKRLNDPVPGMSPKPAPAPDVKGKVLDDGGMPVIGATVTVKGTTRSTATDGNGDFSLNNIEGNATLVITHVNFEAQEIKLNNRTSITVRLAPANRDMESVVVTALGIKRNVQGLGYATSTVKGEELLKAGTTLNPALALYGKAAGVGINIGSAGATGGVNVRIRGAAGLESFARTRPLFVVDGVPIYDKSSSMENVTFDPLNSLDYGSGINDINAEDIESIEILKGAKATVLYGSQGLNGVVLITTKSGKKTRGLGITVSQQVSVEKPFTFIEFQNEYGSGNNQLDTATAVLPNGQRVRIMRPVRYSFGPKFDGQPIMRFDSVMVPYSASPDNFLDFFRNGSSSRTNVAIAGGGEFGSARASYSYIDYKDILMGSYQKNHTFSFNGNFNVSPFANFEFITNMYSIKTRNRRPNLEQVVAWGLNRDYDYNTLKDFYRDEFGYSRDLDGYALPPSATRLMGVIWEQNNNSDIDNKFHTISSLKSTLNFTKHISLVAQAAIDYTNVDYTTENQIVRLLPQTTGGKYQWRKQNIMVQNYQAMLKYDRGFRNNDLHLFAYAGGAYQQVRESNIFAGTGDNGLRFPDWYSIANQLGSGGDQSKIRGIIKGSDLIYGILGSAELSWKNTWILQVDGRNDWNSTLPAGNNSYFYPGVSLVYNFTNDFTQIPQLKYGKLRLAWADVGGGPSTSLENRYFANNSYSVVTIYEGATISAVVPPTALFLGDIKPFRKREFEVGFNTRWFKQNRLEVDFSFYTNNIYDQIIPLNINPATGYATANINSGKVKNWGYEVFIKAAPVSTPTYRWEVTFTAARQLSKVIDLYTGIDEQFITGNNGFKVVATKGRPNGDIQMFDYNRDPAGNRIVNDNGVYTLTNELKTIGNVNPKAFGGVYSDFFYKGFMVHIGIDYKFGGTIFSYSNQYLMGNGVIKASLANRDEAHGGMAYYIDKVSGKKVPWQHNQPAPANATGGIVYHDGMVLPGVKNTGTAAAPKYENNDIIVAAPDYYRTYINDVSTSWPPDRLFKNDYIKLREISLSYTLPQKISNMFKLQKLSVNVAARNLGYLHKTLPNVDAEAVLGAQGYIENSFYPAVRTFSAGVNVSF